MLLKELKAKLTSESLKGFGFFRGGLEPVFEFKGGLGPQETREKTVRQLFLIFLWMGF